MSDTFGAAGSVYVELGARLDGLARDLHTAVARCGNAGDEAAKAFSSQFSVSGSKAFASSAISQIVAGIGVSYGISETAQFLKECFVNATEAQAAIGKLNSALSFIGAGDQSKAMNAFAESLMRVTTLDDEAIRSVMALGASMGKLSGQDLQDATKAAIGLSEKLQIDLSSAMHLVVKAAQGHTETLARVGVVVDENASAQEKYNQVLQQGSAAFKLAEQRAQGYGGQLKELSRNWGEIKENIGTTFASLVNFEALRDVSRVYMQRGLVGGLGAVWSGNFRDTGQEAAGIVPGAKHRVPNVDAMAKGVVGNADNAKRADELAREVAALSDKMSKSPLDQALAANAREAREAWQAGLDPAMVAKRLEAKNLLATRDANEKRRELEESLTQQILMLSGRRWDAERAQIDATYRKMKAAAGDNAELLAKGMRARELAIEDVVKREKEAADQAHEQRQRELADVEREFDRMNDPIQAKRAKAAEDARRLAQQEERDRTRLEKREDDIIRGAIGRTQMMLSQMPRVEGTFDPSRLYGGLGRTRYAPNTMGVMNAPISYGDALTREELRELRMIRELLTRQANREAPRVPARRQ